MRIRPARDEDVPAISALARRAYAIYVARLGRRPRPMDRDYVPQVRDGLVSVAEAGGRVVGVLVLIAAPDHLVVDNVAVDPDRQGEGIGRALLAHGEEEARRAGLPELRLFTNAVMRENLARYPRLGYRETHREAIDGFTRVHFAKRVG